MHCTCRILSLSLLHAMTGDGFVWCPLFACENEQSGGHKTEIMRLINGIVVSARVCFLFAQTQSTCFWLLLHDNWSLFCCGCYFCLRLSQIRLHPNICHVVMCHWECFNVNIHDSSKYWFWFSDDEQRNKVRGYRIISVIIFQTLLYAN